MIGAARSLSQRCSMAKTRQSVLPTLAPRSAGRRSNAVVEPREGGAHANVHTISQLDRPRDPFSQGAPKRAEASKELARKVGVEIKEVYLTSGDNDLVIIVDAPNGDNVAKFALALGALGNVRTRTARAWPQSEFQKLISELP